VRGDGVATQAKFAVHEGCRVEVHARRAGVTARIAPAPRFVLPCSGGGCVGAPTEVTAVASAWICRRHIVSLRAAS